MGDRRQAVVALKSGDSLPINDTHLYSPLISYIHIPAGKRICRIVYAKNINTIVHHLTEKGNYLPGV